jgi:transposase-like protein
MKQPKTLQEAIVFYSNPDNCLNHLVSQRWPNGVECPTCGSKDVRFIPTRRIWECKNKHTKKQFSIKVGTIFEDSPIGLDKWLTAAWMVANCKNGVSSYEIHRAIGVTQKSAWFMLHRIRLAMQDENQGGKLQGHVEVDETFIGGKARFMHKSKRAKVLKRGPSGKAIVVGMLQRGGKVRAQLVENRERQSVQTLVRENIEAGSELSTDEWSAYFGLSREYAHKIINHADAYVDGQVHTNGLENFWSLLKRGLKGTYVSVEPFHLYRYLDEQMFRFNNRATKKYFISDSDRFRMVTSQLVGKRLTYEQLIGRGATA